MFVVNLGRSLASDQIFAVLREWADFPDMASNDSNKVIFVVTIELIGLSCLAVELGILLGKGPMSAHVLGYAGALFVTAGAIAWAKFVKD